MQHKVPELEYSYDALEPYIDEMTMRIHHGRHHKAYVDKLNEALKQHSELSYSAQNMLKDLDHVPQDIRDAVRNHGGGHVNHSFFWKILKKGTQPNGELKEAIEKRFGSMEKFRQEFEQAGMGRFGSGWAWLVKDKGELRIMSTANQDSPLSQGMTPIIGVDIWEHAYYLRYQNRRKEYLEAFFNVINWDAADENFTA